MLELLAKKDNYWRQIAYKICKDKYLADDIVNDMYLKLADNEKAKNDFYVVIVIRNLFIDTTKERKYITIDENFTKEVNTNYELDDNELQLIDSLEWWERDLIELSHDYSLRELGKKLNINYAFIHRTIKRVRNGTTKK